MTDPTISPHEPPALLNRLDYHALRTPQFKELAEAAARIRELEAEVERLRECYETEVLKCAELYKANDALRAENEKLRGALEKVLPPASGVHGGPLVGLRAVYEDGTDEDSARHRGWIRPYFINMARAALNSTDTALATAKESE